MKDYKRPIIDIIAESVLEVPGWCPVDELFAIYLLGISTVGIEGDFLEIGSWCGRSSVSLGMAAKQINTNLHCVDLFPDKSDWFRNKDGTYSFMVKIGDEEFLGMSCQTLWEEPFKKDVLPLYEKYKGGIEGIFNMSITQRNLENNVKAFKGTSQEFLKKYNGKIKLAFLDGDHGYESTCSDITVIEQLLVPGGWIIFDDAFSVYKGVDEAIKELIIGSKKYELMHQLARKCFVAKRKKF